MTNPRLLERITASNAIADGRLTIRGQPLTVEEVLGKLAAGETHQALLRQYSWLETEDIHACLLYAQQLVKQVQTALSVNDLAVAIPRIIEEAPYIRLLILFGSRARGHATQGSDWDFAFICDENSRKQYENGGMSSMRVWVLIQRICRLKDDEIDVVDLRECSDLLAHSVAQEGKPLYEAEPELFDKFRQKHLLSPEKLKEIQQKDRAKIMRTIQNLRNESVQT